MPQAAEAGVGCGVHSEEAVVEGRVLPPHFIERVPEALVREDGAHVRTPVTGGVNNVGQQMGWWR